jgi:hypothetical protein
VFYYFPKLCGEMFQQASEITKEKYSREAGAYLGAPSFLP